MIAGWIRSNEEPCEWCAVWIGPHEHSVREDGTLGNVVRAIIAPPPAAAPGFSALLQSTFREVPVGPPWTHTSIGTDPDPRDP